MIPITLQMDWFQAFADEFRSLDMRKISGGIDAAIEKHGIDAVYPRKELTFKAFELTPLTTVKAVMIGFEPTVDTASGLFLESTNAPIDGMSPQLQKVANVLDTDYPQGFPAATYSGLTSHWAKQGVLMLNLSLTSRAGQLGRHMAHWTFFTDRILQVLLESENNIAFIPFGKTPTEKLYSTNIPFAKNHKIFEFKVGMFLEVNKWLESVGSRPIEW